MLLSDLIAFVLFCSAAAFSPGPNNFMASYSAFNFGLKKTLPIIYGVTFGFPFLIICINFGLSILFKTFLFKTKNCLSRIAMLNNLYPFLTSLCGVVKGQGGS